MAHLQRDVVAPGARPAHFGQVALPGALHVGRVLIGVRAQLRHGRRAHLGVVRRRAVELVAQRSELRARNPRSACVFWVYRDLYTVINMTLSCLGPTPNITHLCLGQPVTM